MLPGNISWLNQPIAPYNILLDCRRNYRSAFAECNVSRSIYDLLKANEKDLKEVAQKGRDGLTAIL